MRKHLTFFVNPRILRMNGEFSMSATPDPATLGQWYPLGAVARVPDGKSAHRLLRRAIDLVRASDGSIAATDTNTGRALPVRIAYELVWVSLGTPARDLFDIPEAREPDRRIVECGALRIRASGLRMIENFLDMAHFPFVHTDILGAEPHTEVAQYRAEIRSDVDEVWATNCQFFQPQAAAASSGGADVAYTYRVMTPSATLLYKSSPNAPGRFDLICLFIQPVEEAVSIAHPVMFLIDESTPLADLVQFQQMILMQDRIILENQRPILLPLEPRSEIPTRADASSVAFRRWIKAKGITYGTTIA